MKQSISAITVVAGLFGSLATISQAALVAGDVINIDLQSPNAASVDGVGDEGPHSQGGTATWNVISGWGNPGTPSALVDASGQDDGLTFSVTANGGWFSPNYTSASPDSAIFDYFQENAAAAIPFSIANVPAGDYELYIIAGVSQWAEGSTTVVSVTGEADQNIAWTGVGDLPSGTGWAEGVNYARFDVSLSDTGTISGLVTGGTDTSTLSSLQLVAAIPEPTTFSMFGLFAGALLLRRQRSAR